jgi:hypothetical protein
MMRGQIYQPFGALPECPTKRRFSLVEVITMARESERM